MDDTPGDGDHATAGNQDGIGSTDTAADGDAGQPSQTRVLALLRTERRLEELEQAIQEAPKTGRKAKWVQRELDEAFQHELRTHALLRAARPEWA